ncbi:MAG: Altered inheritance of mitochondria protein 18 mitochondrial [Icmadophila ericetorum]|nr:Altered inheritance of mitochondria protein 18 mitochondrial [Icmadophila ericetorum]
MPPPPPLSLTQCLRSSTFHRLPLRHQPFRPQRVLPRQQTLSFASRPGRTLIDPLDPISRHRAIEAEARVLKRRAWWSGAGVVVCMISTYLLVVNWDYSTEPEKSDAPPTSNMTKGAPVVGGVTASSTGQEQEKVDKVYTGTSTIPYFPRTVTIPQSKSSPSLALPAGTGDTPEEYQLIGLGIRTVSFLSIQVYVVGMYIAVSDIATLQSRLTRKTTESDTATALVPSEKEKLKGMLLDPEKSEEVWDEVLREGDIRTVFRIVPTRGTDFGHLRDGWVRSITARSQARARKAAAAAAAGTGPVQPGLVDSFEDGQFGESMTLFKAIFGGKGKRGLGKGKALMLERDGKGTLGAWIEGDAPGTFFQMGVVEDERVSRLVWLGYLAGKNVASEGARQNIVEGIMDFVERPVGTVETQVL